MDYMAEVWWWRWLPAAVLCAAVGAWHTMPLSAAVAAARADMTLTASKIAVITGQRACEAELRVADVLRTRLARHSDIECSVVSEETQPTSTADLLIYLGLPQNHDALAALCAANSVAPPTAKDPGPEGFVLRTVRASGTPAIIAAGVDQRGVLYAAGEINRQATCNDGSMAVPEINVRTAPAYRIRGFNGHGSDEQTVDLAFAGGNLCGGPYAQTFGLMTGASFHPNRWWSQNPYPPEWESPTEGKGYVCPSIPEARKALLAQWDEMFRQHAGADIVRFKGGDPGGCRCPRCSPWGKTFVHLCEELAQIWHKYHPNSLIEIATQNLDNAGEQAIFDYLNEKPRTWLWAICYAPGSNAMSRYFRRELREDLLTYPGPGPLNRYLREILNNIPKYQKIDFFSDITHWYSSQYEVPNPEPHLVAVYGRRTFHVRPRQLYAVFQATMLFSEGDRPYSEGIYDEFNQYMWNRLMWAPHRPLEDVVMEYCRLNFGAAAAPEMAQAMFQLEKNLEAPLATNDGIDRFYVLVKSAGFKIPPHIMRYDFRWRLYMQKAALDKYVQLQLRHQMDMRDRATRALKQALAAGDAGAAAAAAAILGEAQETPEMAVLHAEAERLANELANLDPLEDRLTQTGTHYSGAHYILLPETPNEIYQEWERYKYRLNLDFVGSDWMRRCLERAQKAAGADRLRLLQEMVSYEDPGPGGFYDDLGSRERPSRLINGETIDLSRWLDPENRPSANTVAYTLGGERGVTLRYEGLDPSAQYKLRLTMAAPQRRGLPGANRLQGENKQHVVANGYYLARDVEVPVYAARQFEYDIPQELTRGGTLDLWLERGTGGLGTVASEVWLIKRR